jgi:endo-1,3(4)-beta-glucanase
MQNSTFGLNKVLIALFLLYLTSHQAFGQYVQVGNGSYTTVFPGGDIAGRNTFPSGTPYVSGVAATKPIPTNDWWSAKVKTPHVNNLFTYPMALRTVNSGLVLSYIPAPSGPNGSSQPMDDALPIIVGVTDLNASAATVADHSDFTVTMNWANGTHSFNATAGIAMPFIYFTKTDTDIAKIVINTGTVTVNEEVLIIQNAHNGADFAIYAPSGSAWIQSGNSYTSTLNDKNYWSAAYLPPSATNLTGVANEYKKYAYVFPENTLTEWDYDESTSVITTIFTVATQIMEGSETNVLLGLLPHHWSNLSANSPLPEGYSYSSIRGQIKTLDGNSFTIENTFRGILPTLPYLNNYSPGFSPSVLNEKIALLENEGLSTWTDSYNEGQVMNRLIQTARIADLTGNTTARDKIVATIKERLEDWLTAEPEEVAFIFYYNSNWTALIGYPAGHGQDGNLNDHHFHWGYFIHAASFLEQFEPGWAEGWGEMINHLVRDAASTDRNDPLFPFLRNFSPYAGHSWANGFATFPFGNDQESTSESMQFNSSLIHWGTITGNDEIRNLGIYLYTTEQTAVEEYWFDMYERTFKPEYNFSLASRIWGNGYDNQTFWTSDIAAAYGIELYPIHGGSLYLGQNLDYVLKLWTEMTVNTGILNNQPNDNLWHDVYWEYLAFLDPQAAINLYDSYPDRSLKFGISDAQTYHWLHAMNVLGHVDATLTADYPIAAVFNNNGEKIYTAHNYTDASITVSFSDGFQLNVPAYKMVTSRDVAITGELTSSFPQAFINGSVDLEVTISDGSATKIEFFDGTSFLGESNQAPYTFKVENLSAGKHHFYARMYQDDAFNLTNIVPVIVGRQMPWTGVASAIPGTIEAGLYDKFEGGNGQNVAYVDVSVANEGGFRPAEYVDAALDNTEGAMVGWIANGEWLEYSIHAQQPGLYQLAFRCASGNATGGGPFYFELNGTAVSDSIFINDTGGWDVWATRTVENIALPRGEHILRVVFKGGEFNLGKMTFTYSGPLPYNQPVADAGENVVVIIPEDTATLDGSGSFDPGAEPLTYKWTQLYGPTVVTFSNSTLPNPTVSSMEKGVYQFSLKVTNSSNSDTDEMYVIVSETANIPPTVAITFPENNSEVTVGKSFEVTAEASDLDGSVIKVDFYESEILIGTSSSPPFFIEWTIDQTGEHMITAIATDNNGNTATSQPVTLFAIEAPPCRATAFNGEFDYEFSPDETNPTLTFIPSTPGVGSPTCILYYSTSPSQPFPGYNVTPDTPHQLNAATGSTVYFYYTYSYPGQGEHTTIGNIVAFEVGFCQPASIIDEQMNESIISYSPNPVNNLLNIIFDGKENLGKVFDIRGNLLDEFTAQNSVFTYNMSSYAPGIYIFSVRNHSGVHHFKIVKE